MGYIGGLNMKILFISCSLFWLAIVGVSLADSIEIGLKGGINFSNTYGIDSEIFGQTPLIGYNAGFFSDFKIINDIFFQPEVLITLKGGKGSDISNYYYNNTFYRTYLEIPALIKANVFSVDGTKINLLAGPFLGFLINNTNLNLLDNYGEQYYEYYDYGLALGVSFEYINFVLDGRFDLGLNNFYKGKYLVFNVDEIKDESFMISLGYKVLKF